MNTNLMKPLLIIPPAPNRWSSIDDYLNGATEARIADLRNRFDAPLTDARDAFAIIPNGSLTLAFASIRRMGDIGVFGELSTRPDHRLRGFARSLIQTLLSWFDMTGGKWLYLTTPGALAPAIFENFGFRLLHRSGESDAVSMLRTLSHVAESPYRGGSGPVRVRDVVRSDWPLIVALLQHHGGADPRVAIADSAAFAEATATDLLNQQDGGACKLLGAESGGKLLGLASLAVDQLGKRSYAMILPHSGGPAELTEAAVALGSAKGYERVEFPLSALANPAPASETAPA
jgi:GNAT superfamily N-acetyltransferase